MLKFFNPKLAGTGQGLFPGVKKVQAQFNKTHEDDSTGAHNEGLHSDSGLADSGRIATTNWTGLGRAPLRTSSFPKRLDQLAQTEDVVDFQSRLPDGTLEAANLRPPPPPPLLARPRVEPALKAASRVKDQPPQSPGTSFADFQPEFLWGYHEPEPLTELFGTPEASKGRAELDQLPIPDEVTPADDFTQWDTNSSNTSSRFDASYSRRALGHAMQFAGSQLGASTLLTQFDIKEMLGRGGFGAVFKAKDLLDGQFYALKVIPVDSTSPDYELTLQEVKVMAELKPHPNVVRYHSVWREHINPAVRKMLSSEDLDAQIEDLDICDTIVVIKMECFDRDLKQVLDNRRGVDRVLNLRIFRDVMLGVSHIHRSGIMHRDLKPSNIFLKTDDGGNITQVAIGDFGLATHNAEDDSLGVGTAIYAAPEQKTRQLYDERADVYSLGIILFELFHKWNTGSERIFCLTRLRAGDPGMLSRMFPTIASIVLRAIAPMEQRIDSSLLLEEVFSQVAKHCPSDQDQHRSKASLLSELNILRMKLAKRITA